MNFEQKKKEIAERMAESKHIETPRQKHIRETNENSPMKKSFFKDRHERRNGGGKKTTLQERESFMKLASKER